VGQPEELTELTHDRDSEGVREGERVRKGKRIKFLGVETRVGFAGSSSCTYQVEVVLSTFHHFGERGHIPEL
jgi:hypothetical protein